MKTLKNFLKEKGITEEAFGKLEADEQAKLYNELNELNSEAYKALEEKVAKGASKEELEALSTEMKAARKEQFEQLNETLKLQGLAIKNAKNLDKGDISLTSGESLKGNFLMFSLLYELVKF